MTLDSDVIETPVKAVMDMSEKEYWEYVNAEIKKQVEDHRKAKRLKEKHR